MIQNLWLLIYLIVATVGNYTISTLSQTTQSDWVSNHTVFLGLPVNNQSQILMKNSVNETRLFMVNLTLTDIKTHPENSLDEGYLLGTDSKNNFFYIDLENENDTQISANNVIHFGFGVNNIQVLYITNFGDDLYEYNISSGETFVHVLPSNNGGGYGAHNLAIEENRIICHMGKSNYEDLMIKYDVETQIQIFAFHSYRTFGTKISSSEPFYSSYWGYESLSLSMNQTVYTHNNDAKIWNQNGDLIYMKIFNHTKILCSVYAEGYLGLVVMEQATQKCYLWVIDISNDHKVIEKEVIAPSLKICSMKYFIETRILSLHMFRSDSIAFFDISSLWQNITNNSSMINNSMIQKEGEINGLELQEENADQYSEILQSMNSTNFQTITNTSSITVGLLMSSPIANIGIRPLFNFIDDFWPYSYHQKQYPSLIEYFIADTNIFSALRINPFNSYNFRSNIQALEQSNNLHQKHDAKFIKYPKDSLFIFSISQVYTFNFGFSFACFLTFSLLGFLLKYCRKQQEGDQQQIKVKEKDKMNKKNENNKSKKKKHQKQKDKQEENKEKEKKLKKQWKQNNLAEADKNKETGYLDKEQIKQKIQQKQSPNKKQTITPENQEQQGYFSVKQCWFKLVFSLLLPNTVNIVFFSLINIRNQYHLTFIDKINSLVTLTSLFIWIIASICLYLLVYQFWNKQSKKIHEVSKEGLEGIVLQTVLNNVRGLVRAFIHGLFIYSHKQQLFLLVCADLVIIIWIHSMRKHYISSLTYLLSFMYLFGFLLFDTLLLSEGYYRIQNLDYEKTLGILIIIILCLTLMQMVNLMIIGMIGLCRKLQIIKSNKVQLKNQASQLEANNEIRKKRTSTPHKKESKVIYKAYFQPTGDASNRDQISIHNKTIMMVEIHNISHHNSAQSEKW